MKIPQFEVIVSKKIPAADCDLVAYDADHGPYVETIKKVSPAIKPLFVRFAGNNGAQHFLALDLSKTETEKLRQTAGTAYAKLTSEKISSVRIAGTLFSNDIQKLTAFAEGLILPAYKFNKHKSKPAAKKGEIEYTGLDRILFVVENARLQKELQQQLDIVTATAEAMKVARDWSNEPSNAGTPEFFANEARRFAKTYGLKCKVLSEIDAKREKMGLFLAVGAGSDRESKIVVLEYTPKKKNPAAKTLALVGKGITFDSGGISIKPSARMEEMKHDMTGAAIVMGGILLASRMQVQNKIIAILGFAENMPNGIAVQPGNIIKARNGKTVEITNTDAEGRLILADLLDYACDFNPDAIINAATLTGAIAVALGKIRCGLMANNDAFAKKVIDAADHCGEKAWQLPMDDEYLEDMKAEHADLRNAAGDPNGGSIRGAIFMKQFIRKDIPWAHLDIASVAYNIAHLSYIPKRGASGLFVRTLARLADQF